MSRGEPIIGASVLEKGTTNGTITDLDGRFTLSIGKGLNYYDCFLCRLYHKDRENR